MTSTLSTEAQFAITGWCAREAAVRGQDHAAATYSDTVAAASTYTAGGLGYPPDTLDLTAEELEQLAELAERARDRLALWTKTGWLPPEERAQLLFTLRADLAGIPHDDSEGRAAASAILTEVETWDAEAPAAPPSPVAVGEPTQGELFSI